MKTIFSAFFSILIASLTFAETNTWVGSTNNWWYQTSNSAHLAFWDLNRSPIATDDVLLDGLRFPSTTYYSVRYAWGKDTSNTINSLTFQNAKTSTGTNAEIVLSALYENQTLHVTNDVNFKAAISQATMSITGFMEKGKTQFGYLNLYVGGNINLGSVSDPTDLGQAKGGLALVNLGGTGYEATSTYDSANGTLGKLVVEGDLNIYGVSQLRMSVGRNTSTIDNPDVKIKGVVNLNNFASGQNPSWYLNSKNNGTDGLNTIIELGGLKGSGIITNETGTRGGSSTLVFKNAAGTTYQTGITIQDTEIKSDGTVNASSSKIKIIMDGEGTQIFNPGWETEKRFFSGGVEIKKGSLFMYSNHVDSTGDITLYGGNLGVSPSGSSSKIGHLYAKNLYWNDGNILLDATKDSIEKIYLKEGLFRDQNLGNGFNFKFTFLDSDMGDIESKEWNILEWDNTIFATDILSEEFIANEIQYNSKTYQANFDIRNDGLWVSFSQTIPEPAHTTLILLTLLLFLKGRNSPFGD